MSVPLLLHNKIHNIRIVLLHLNNSWKKTRWYRFQFRGVGSFVPDQLHPGFKFKQWSGFKEMAKLCPQNEWDSPVQITSRPCTQALIPKAERRRLCSGGLSRVAGGGGGLITSQIRCILHREFITPLIPAHWNSYAYRTHTHTYTHTLPSRIKIP